MSNSKLVFLDIDGTILSNFDTVAESTVKAVKMAVDNGHKLFLCTGRELSFVDKRVLELGITDGVFSSGANIICDGQLIYHSSFDRKSYQHMIKVFEETNTYYIFETFTDNYLSRDISAYFKPPVDKVESKFIIMNKIPSYRDDVDKVLFVKSDADYIQLSDMLGDAFHVIPASYFPESNSGEVMQARISKSTGIGKVLSYYGRSISDTVAIGDGYNDIEMLKYCNTGVAMGNAPDEIKAIADYVTDDIGSDGLYNAFKHLDLI